MVCSLRFILQYTGSKYAGCMCNSLVPCFTSFTSFTGPNQSDESQGSQFAVCPICRRARISCVLCVHRVLRMFACSDRIPRVRVRQTFVRSPDPHLTGEVDKLTKSTGPDRIRSKEVISIWLSFPAFSKHFQTFSNMPGKSFYSVLSCMCSTLPTVTKHKLLWISSEFNGKNVPGRSQKGCSNLSFCRLDISCRVQHDPNMSTHCLNTNRGRFVCPSGAVPLTLMTFPDDTCSWWRCRSPLRQSLAM